LISFLIINLFSCSVKNESHKGFFEHSIDVGDVKHQGRTEYNPENEKYTLTGSGTNMWRHSDEFHFAWKKVTGNLLLYTMVEFVGEGVDEHHPYVISHFYGGQGTEYVPSWSPDSIKVAFVSSHTQKADP